MNGENRNRSTELGKLMSDFFCTDPDDMHFRELADKARYFKQDEKGAASMCKVLEDMRNEVAKETEWQTKVDITLRLLKMGLSYEQIAEAANLTVEQVKEIAGQKTA